MLACCLHACMQLKDVEKNFRMSKATQGHRKQLHDASDGRCQSGQWPQTGQLAECTPSFTNTH